MITPVSNNNPATTANNKAASSEGRGNQTAAKTVSQAEPVANKQNIDEVSVSRAAEVLSQATAERGQGTIQSPDQAAELVQQLKTLFQNNPAQALASQAGDVPASIMDLLKVG